jgi:hypothetical protein
MRQFFNKFSEVENCYVKRIIQLTFENDLPDTPAAAQAAAPSAAAKAGRACGKCSEQSFILTSELNSCAAEWELAILKNEKY